MEASGNSLAECLDRVIRARGRLLRVERVPLPGPVGARASSSLRLTFDVGILTLRPGEEGSGLEVEIGLGGCSGPGEFVSASEDDPWWTVMGSPLARVQSRETGGVRVQFRGDGENPRRFAIFTRNGGVEASLNL
jgi:hypothetical protein